MSNEPAPRAFLIWWVCGLLLCASTINYMDRMTLSTASKRIKSEFSLTNEQYGTLETMFSLAFAVGSTGFGFIADRMNVRWLYPIVLLLWSLMGFLTGYVETFMGLLLCRTFLGLFEAGHWPCALKTTHRLLPPESRTLGNSVLQSGTAIGAIITPVVMGFMLTPATGSWRPAFQIIAGVGVIWIVAWILSTNSKDLAPVAAIKDRPTDQVAVPTQTTPAIDETADSDSLWKVIFGRKFFVLVIIVTAINAGAQLFRAWMPLFLQAGRGYDEEFMLTFMFFYYVANDIGCLSGGYLTRRFHTAGFSVHASRTLVFGFCALLVAAGGLIPWLPAGPGLMTALLTVALGSLGLFPCFYSFCQDLSTRHQGKVLGLLGTIAWVTTAPLHILLGRWVDQTKSYDLGMSLVCGLPLAALFVLVLFWPETKLEPKYNSTATLL